jgi:hypothetical protein
MIFSKDAVPISLDLISQELTSGLSPELADPFVGDKPWTKAVKTGLCGIGKSLKLLVFCNDAKDHDQGEWLLDLIWMLPNDEWRIVLAVESEWGQPCSPNTEAWEKLEKMIAEDFGKLLSIKARHKLFCFRTTNHVGADRILQRLRLMTLAYPYHLEGEEYMLIERTAQGAFRYWFEVPCDGRLESVEFNQMDAPLPWPWAKGAPPVDGR